MGSLDGQTCARVCFGLGWGWKTCARFCRKASLLETCRKNGRTPRQNDFMHLANEFRFVCWLIFLRIGASRSAFWGAKSTQDLHFQQQSVGGVRGQLTTAAVYLLGSRGASVSRSCVEPYNVIGRCCFQNGSVLAFMFFLFRSLVSHTMNPRSTKPFVKVERWAQWWCHLAGCRSIEWWMVMRNEILYICHGVVT